MAAVQIFFSQFRIKAHRDVGRFHEKKAVSRLSSTHAARFEKGSVYAFAVIEQRLKFFDREKGVRVPPALATLRQA